MEALQCMMPTIDGSHVEKTRIKSQIEQKRSKKFHPENYKQLQTRRR